jgi:hypothetical protein
MSDKLSSDEPQPSIATQLLGRDIAVLPVDLQDKGDYVLPSGLTVSQCHKEIIARANLIPSLDDEENLIPQ